MNRVILGLNLFGHDASVCLLEEESGKVLYATAEERLSNLKHDSHFPVGALQACRQMCTDRGWGIEDVAINFKEENFFQHVVSTKLSQLRIAEVLREEFIDDLKRLLVCGEHYYQDTTVKNVIDSRLDALGLSNEKKELQRTLGWYFNWAVKYRKIKNMLVQLFPYAKLHQFDHHLCHAASAFYNSGFSEAAVLTLDGQGESECSCIYRAKKDGTIEPLSSIHYPHSLGILYLNATIHLGFKQHDEYKVMGMSAYGKPVFVDELKKILRLSDGGQYSFVENFGLKRIQFSGTGHEGFDYRSYFSQLIKPRKKSEDLVQAHFDFAASIQKLVEFAGLHMATQALKMADSKNICIAGGVGLNGLMNEVIRKESGCSEIFIYPASGDDGTSIGAAQLVRQKKGCGKMSSKISNCYYGFSAENDEIITLLNTKGIHYTRCDNINREIAVRIHEHKIVARYRGGAEFGPRALGCRSILANPTKASAKAILNERIKHREPFRPFAPACLLDKVHELFDVKEGLEAPYMLLIVTCKETAKDKIPAVVHEDNTARVQAVSQTFNQDFYQTIAEFEKLSGVPVLINTSFNVNGEAIVDTPEDALESFLHMDIDYLAIGDCLISKEENVEHALNLSDADYLMLRRKRFHEHHSDILKEIDLAAIPYYFKDEGMGSLAKSILQKVKNL